MDGDKRRKEIMELLNTEKDPLSGTSLAKRLGVSRQVIVQDIALLRATNRNILSTNRGYILYGKQEDKLTCKRVVAVKHTDEQMRDEIGNTSELQSQDSISYAVFCLKKKKTRKTNRTVADSADAE